MYKIYKGEGYVIPDKWLEEHDKEVRSKAIEDLKKKIADDLKKSSLDMGLPEVIGNGYHIKPCKMVRLENCLTIIKNY